MPKTLKIQIFLHLNIKIKINCRFNTYSMYLHTSGQRCKLLWAMKCSQDSLYHFRVARKYVNLGKNSTFNKEKSPLVFPLLPPLWKKQQQFVQGLLIFVTNLVVMKERTGHQFSLPWAHRDLEEDSLHQGKKGGTAETSLHVFYSSTSYMHLSL